MKDQIKYLFTNYQKIFRTNSTFWFETNKHIYTPLPINKPVNINKAELPFIFALEKNCFALRYISYNPPGSKSFLINCNDNKYNLFSLSKKSRNQTKRGLEQCVIRRLTEFDLLDEGFKLNQDTLSRQNRFINSDKKEWNAYINIMYDCPGYEFWGAFVDNNLAAYIGFFIVNNWVSIMIQRSRSDYLKYYPNNALTYEITRMLLVDRAVECVSYGITSFESISSLNDYKMNMGYTQIPIFQRIYVKPIINFFLELIPSNLFKDLTNYFPNGSKLKKILLSLPIIKASKMQ